MINLIVCGVCGKMGRRIATLAIQTDKFKLVGATEANTDCVGKDIGSLLGISPINVKVSEKLSDCIDQGDCVIDFTNCKATLENVRCACENKKSIVIGTTGCDTDSIEQIKKLSVMCPIVMAPNMSLGVNILFEIVKETARYLGSDFDVEIVEMHHRAKKDAPSGTALKLAHMVAEGLGISFEQNARFSRVGEAPRAKNEIGIMALRGGDVVGEHTVIFAGDAERIEITHKASSRDVFAKGALKAASWVVDKLPGFYDMNDVLGIKSK
ncbi:4-hydroxy-tetrahydrodipicolinate reductase [Desulfurella sp.]|uniref:4-hydroxy-tetrahydrodipicolinate reductase n=1 Tax=Desulfurella sp. TaxID=1962857 RepID=UPI0025C23B48|nr:4-hydroxy-tetrahydrodipicolinate reductase [Desulfurella sp.]